MKDVNKWKRCFLYRGLPAAAFLFIVSIPDDLYVEFGVIEIIVMGLAISAFSYFFDKRV